MSKVFVELAQLSQQQQQLCWHCYSKRFYQDTESDDDEEHLSIGNASDDEYALAARLSHENLSRSQWCALWDSLYCNPYCVPRAPLCPTYDRWLRDAGYQVSGPQGTCLVFCS
jgi:hypothetical protein